MELLDRYNIPVSGKNVVIVGRSDLVGKPMAMMMLNRDATVSVCHSKTSNLSKFTKEADIFVVAVGKPNFITKDMIRDDQIVIDVGIAFDENGKLCGDCEKGMGNNVTPVPGGVGLLTRLALLENVMNINRR